MAIPGKTPWTCGSASVGSDRPRHPRTVSGAPHTLAPAKRGELDITDVNNASLARGDLTYDILEGWWTDSGTFQSLHKANCLVVADGANRVSTSATPMAHGAAAGA